MDKIMTIDLHGFTVHQAWRVFTSRVDQAYYSGHRTCKIITGYGSIQAEMPVWCYNHDKIDTWRQMTPNKGAFVVKLRKVK